MNGTDESHLNRVVGFTRMQDGTREDYRLLERYERDYLQDLPERILAALEKLKHSYGGYSLSRLDHSLQAATRAANDGADEELVAAALIHDVGDDLAPCNHAEIAAAIIRPYVRPEVDLDRRTARVVSKLLLRPSPGRQSRRARAVPGASLVPGVRGVLRQLGSMLVRSELSMAPARCICAACAPDLHPAGA